MRLPSLRAMLLAIFLGYLPPELAAQKNGADNFQPVPYEADEFPQFLQDLRRFEVILLGSIPITLLFGSLVYDIVYSISEPNINSLEVATSDAAIFQKIGISISISALLAVLDIAIHLGQRQKARKERERIQRDSGPVQKAEPPAAQSAGEP